MSQIPLEFSLLPLGILPSKIFSWRASTKQEGHRRSASALASGVMQLPRTSVSLGDLFPAFFETALSHHLGILSKLQDKYFWKPNDIWFSQNWDKDKVHVQEGKRQESHSPLLAEAYLVSKLHTNGAVERNGVNWSSTERAVFLLHLQAPGRAAVWNVGRPNLDLTRC